MRGNVGPAARAVPLGGWGMSGLRWSLVALAAVAVLVAALVLFRVPRPPASVTYEVWGPPSAAQVAYGDVASAPYGAVVLDAPELPWRLTAASAPSGARDVWVRVAAGVPVSCRVSTEGRVLAEASGAGEVRCESGQAAR